MANFKNIESLVLDILENHEESRRDDYILIYLVCQKLNPELNKMPFGEALYHHYEVEMPNWETVTRVRRKIQEKRPELRDMAIVDVRTEEFKRYVEYSRT